MTLEAIKEAIACLPATDKATLATWLNAQDAQEWDRQMEVDFSEGGAGTPLLAQWDAEIRTGTSIQLEEFLASQEDHSRKRNPGE
ncbi:MAG TPA: hypothetical protein VMF91_20245 [Bryobacteraceae bacterium]|nr:hypothetical protein [Bryobacteraceae bacterium]